MGKYSKKQNNVVSWTERQRPLEKRRNACRCVLALGALLALSGASALAQNIGVTVNGSPVNFPDIGPQEMEGRVLVPVRGVLEKLGANVAWLPQTHTVVASNAQMDIQLKIGDRNATVNGQNVTLDVPAQVVGGHTMVPLRFLGEALGANVGWNGQTHTVEIITKDNLNASSPEERRIRQHARPGGRPTVDSFADDANGWLRAGSTLRVRMQGAPGGQAAFRIPGLTEDIPMREIEPGRYVGSWQVPEGRPGQIANAAVIGSLRMGDATAPLIQAAQTVSVDAMPPQIRDRAPEPDSRVTTARPTIYAVFEDSGSGVAPRSIRLDIDGRDVTPEATVTRDFISYTPANPLPPGPHTVRIRLADRADNGIENRWTFVAAPNERERIQSVSFGPERSLQPGDRLHVEAVGTPGSRAFFSAGNVRSVPLRETSPGHYAADYTIRRGDDTNGGRLAVRLVTPDGQTFTRQSQQNITVHTGPPTEPVITQPGPNAAAANPLVIKGRGTPNTKVHVTVTYQNRLFGVLAVHGTAADVVVNVDPNGNWQTEPIDLSSLLPTGNMQYTVSATAINAANQSSPTRQMQFRL